MTHLTHDWPEDADGDVFRRLLEHGFDFSKLYSVDYNVDFSSWPPSAEAVATLEATYGSVVLYAPGDCMDGYCLFKVFGPVTYEGVTSVQREVSAAMEPYSGVCESWGVMQDAP